MASIRAYYLPTESASAIDASHPASVEQLSALGWNISSVGGSPDEITQAGQKLAQELGFPVTQEGCIAPFDFDIEKNAAKLAPEMAALLMKVAEVKNRDLCYVNGVVIAVTSGNPDLDVEDIATASWIRIPLDAGALFAAPTGAKFRLPINEQTKGTTGIAFYKETISNHGLIVKEDIDHHPARQAYLKEVLGQT